MNYLTLMVSAYLAMTSFHKGELNVDQQEWEAFKETHGKSYESGEIEQLRKTLYAYNKQKVEQFNSNNEAQWSLGLNHLSDMSSLEVKTTMFGLKASKGERRVNSAKAEQYLRDILAQGENKPIPESLDWRKVPGRVTAIKNQGQCGSCWAFSTVGALEGQEYRKGAKNGSKTFGDEDLVNLSEQNLLDCDSFESGCSGGLMDTAFLFVDREGGINDAKSYPYEEVQKECRFKPNKIAMTDEGVVVLPRGDEETLKKVVALYGPVSIGIDASGDFFQLYRSGVYQVKKCGNKMTDINHAVLIVGYGTDKEQGDFWLVKNSWGEIWGESGYIKMARNKNNQCGIATFPVIPIV